MTFVQFSAVIVAVVSIIFVCLALKKAQNPFKSAFLSAFFGVASLGAVNLLSLYTGVTLAVNYVTSFVTVVLGAPGVICLLMLKLLVQY